MDIECVDIPILEDDITENTEIFNVFISSNNPDVSSINSTAEVSIIDENNVTIGLEKDVYQVNEDQGFVEVCAAVSVGELDKDVVVMLTTNDRSAQCKCSSQASSLKIEWENNSIVIT